MSVRHTLTVGFISALLLMTSSQTLAQTRYIDDTLYVPVRSGQGTQYRIVHKGIKSGTRVTLLDTDKASNYSKIRTAGGTEGWIPSQYLKSQPTASIQLERANNTITKLRAEIDPLKARIRELESTSNSLGSELKKTQTGSDKLNQELSRIKKISANAIALDRSNRELVNTHETLKSEYDVVNSENMRLKAQIKSDNFFKIVLSLALGAFIAIIAPYLKPKRRRSDWA